MRTETLPESRRNDASALELTTISEQRLQLRKRRYRDPCTTPLHIRPLLAVEDVIRYVLIRSGVSSRLVTFSWFIVGLTAHLATAYGALWSFALGAILVYLKIILDITDGEIGRYQKRFMDERQDVVSHMKGIYLDRIQHAIESPLWGVALGVGAYRLTGNKWMLLCGLLIAIFRLFWRFENILRQHINDMFKERLNVETLKEPQQQLVGTAQEAVRKTFGIRFWESVTLWFRNGKRFNLLVFSCAGVDLILDSVFEFSGFLPTLVIAAGIIAPLSMAVRILSSQFGRLLIDGSQSTAHSSGSL